MCRAHKQQCSSKQDHDPATWLEDKLKEHSTGDELGEEEHGDKYTLDDLEGCEEQQEIVYTVLQKLKEWVILGTKMKPVHTSVTIMTRT